jgi:aminoglycoside 2''-phosphotransferase
VAKLSKERKLLPGLGEWVPLPVPEYEYFHESGEGAGRTFGGYRKLPGISGDLSKMVDRRTVARQLGKFLEKLHAYPVEKARDAGVPEERDLVARWRDKSRDQLGGLIDPKVNRSLLQRYLQNDAPPAYDGALSLVHNDLWPEHILVDARSGVANGIIDWGDALIGDPAIDFACLYAWQGESWLKEVLTHYAGNLDPEVIRRARYLATCLAIHNITLGHHDGRALWTEAGYAALRLTHAE